MPVAGLRKAELRFTLSNGDEAVNVVHYTDPAPGVFDETEANALAAGIETEYWDVLKPVIADNVVCDTITVSDASGPGGTGLSFEVPVGTAGTLAADPLPFQVALVGSFYTGLNSRRGRGRIYICGFTETANTSSGFCVSTTVTVVANALAGLQSPTVNHDLVVYSRIGDVANDVTTIKVNSRWDIQRRRNNK